MYREAEARREKRGGPEEIFDANETQLRLRDAYLNCAEDYPNTQMWSRATVQLRKSQNVSRLSTFTFRLKNKKSRPKGAVYFSRRLIKYLT